MLVDDRDRALGRARTFLGRAGRVGVENALQTKAEERLCRVDRRAKCIGVGLSQFARILALREQRNADADLVRRFPFLEALRCTLSR
ncbi:MAG: hypothetical protein ACKOA5_06910, partial [Actinomycetota bacterium]